ncbi:MAG TPA: hypothetical protein VGP82_00485 [Ktedonobacterales bacterium]|jgi:hypothetical protein|nr:hypothetical protein [Ktedonobacterales bacterium]
MESDDTIITAKLDALRKELAKKELEDRKEEEEKEAEDERSGLEPGTYLAEEARPSDLQLDRWAAIDTLRIQVALLEDLHALVEAQTSANQASFQAIEARGAHSSRQSLWLTIISSTISLIVGWSLSLLGTPAAIVHAFGR